MLFYHKLFVTLSSVVLSFDTMLLLMRESRKAWGKQVFLKYKSLGSSGLLLNFADFTSILACWYISGLMLGVK